MAERIVRALPVEIEPVGLFVNRPAEEIIETAKHTRLTMIQLHGDEPPEVAAKLVEAGLEVLRAVRVDESTIGLLASAVEQHRGIPLRAILVDARVGSAYGGTGHMAPWKEIAAVWQNDWPKLIVAGGLTETNVGSAIEALNPHGVDTASGVESSPGTKDPARVRAFIERARNGEMSQKKSPGAAPPGP
jgi:phosphoribosylanthranilate isomerase